MTVGGSINLCDAASVSREWLHLDLSIADKSDSDCLRDSEKVHESGMLSVISCTKIYTPAIRISIPSGYRM